MSAFINTFLIPDALTAKAASNHEILSHEIEVLLNHVRTQSNLGVVECIARSVLYYGVPSYIGKQINDIDLYEISKEIKVALCRFEPRLDGLSISVKPVTGSQMSSGACQIEVQAELMAPISPVTHSSRAGTNNKFTCQYRLDLHFGGAKTSFIHRDDCGGN